MMSPPKKCAVCGDKALGYNFNAVTCESCKAFFRRNALAKKQFTCPFSQNCEITVVTRRFCQKCRLKKCLDIGMKSENIMSEEDKLIKRRKIESNRAKRKQNEQKDKSVIAGEPQRQQQQQQAADSSGFDGASCDSQSCGSMEDSSSGGDGSAAHVTGTETAAASSSTSHTNRMLWDMNPELMTSEEMVEFIVGDPDRACQAINKIMRTPKEALSTLEKIINSQKDALRLISHLIAFPGDALKIISKLMNSPLNALTVFTKFMSSPTDALEIISKIVDSPQDVLQFIKNLMDSPENALGIMNKFMNTPAEALKIINRIFNGSNEQPPAPLKTDSSESTADNEPIALAMLQHPQIQSQQLQPPSQQQQQLPEELASPFHSPITPQSQMHSPATASSENGIIYSILNSNSSSSQLRQPQPLLSPYTPSPQSMSIAASSPDLQEFHSPVSLQAHDELPSTSAGLIASSPAHITPTAELTNDSFDIKSFMDSFGDTNNQMDSLNSLESVLTEVIRIEFQAFNNLPPEPRIKQEQQLMQLLSPKQQGEFVHCSSPQQSICSPSNVVMGRDLNEPEQLKLRELKLASETLYYPVDDDLNALMAGDDTIKPEEAHQDPKLLHVINLTAVAIKRLIKMAKKISAFRDMCQEDQVALLKGGCTEMMILRSVMTYDNRFNTWRIPHTKENMSNIRAEVLKLAPGNVYEEHLKFIRTFDEKWRLDENIILILCAIVLFTPTRPRVVHTDVIKLEQNSYYYLLRRYLESVYSGCEAKSVFIKLIQKVADVERLNQVIIGVYLNVNPAQVEPLLREIFDLKNH